MQRLQDIAVKVASSDGSYFNQSHARPILHEIHHALHRFENEGVNTTIDLRSIPFGPRGEAMLLEVLGRGEVSIEIYSLGISLIWESAYTGVWIIDHRNEEGERVALQVEVGQIPKIVLAQPEDISDAIHQLDSELVKPSQSDD
jgi:hydrogenase-1 operon protein HyaF